MTTRIPGPARGAPQRRAGLEHAGLGFSSWLVPAVCVLALACGTASRAPLPLPAPALTAADRIRATLAEAARPGGPPALADSFYARRDDRPAWTDERGLLPRAVNLLAVVADAGADGLEPADYPVAELLRLGAHGGERDSLARFDVLASQTFLAYGVHLSAGRVRASAADTLWVAADHGLDLRAMLERLVREDRVAEGLSELRPARLGARVGRACHYRDTPSTRQDDFSERRGRMNAREIMTPNPRCVLRGETITRAAELLAHLNCGALPVVRDLETNALVGILTDRDIVTRCTAAKHDPADCVVEDHMSGHPLSLGPEASLEEIADLMSRIQVRRVPITEEPDRRVVGIVALADLVTRAKRRDLCEKVVERVSEPAPVEIAG